MAHLDMDAFYVSVELRRRPELRGLPVVVAGTGPRAVVTTASYEARRFGVGSAMPAARARRLCPDGGVPASGLSLLPGGLGQVMSIVRAHVETVEVIGLDEAYLELTGLPAPHASMRRIRSEIEAATGLPARSGIGPSKLVAKVASDAEKPRGFVVLNREQAVCPVSPARRAGSCRVSARRPCSGCASCGSRRWGSSPAPRAGGALRRASAPRAAAELQRRARFEDDAPVTQERKVVSESRETTFDRDIADPARARADPRRAGRAPVRRPGRPGPLRAHDRDQGPPR